MMSVKIFAILFVAFVCFEVCRGAAVRDIARNVRSELVNFDAGLNPQSRRSKGLDLDVPAGNSITYVLYLKSKCREIKVPYAHHYSPRLPPFSRSLSLFSWFFSRKFGP